MANNEYDLDTFKSLAEDLYDLARDLKNELEDLDEEDFNLTKADYLSFYKGVEAIYAHKPEV